MKVDSIIFDLDGTLWDSTDVVVKAWNNIIEEDESFKSYKITREAIEAIMGLQISQIGPKLFPGTEAKEQARIMRMCLEEEKRLLSKEGGILFKHLEPVLEALSKSHPLYIVSNCECGYIETFLEHHRLNRYFKDFECAGNTGLSKGENIKEIMSRNSLKKAAYVGDTQGDCDAAKKAGIPFVYASYGFGRVNSYDEKLNELMDLLELFNDSKR